MTRIYVQSDPPPVGSGNHGAPAAFVEVLDDHPGEWYEYLPDAGGVSSQMAHYLKTRYGLEVRMKTVSREPLRYRVWARRPVV